MSIDTIALTRDLIRRPSVTPNDAGALDVLQKALESLGFKCQRLPFGAGAERVDNLYARHDGRSGGGTEAGKNSGKNFCFAGHTDVVPTGDLKGWSVDPFGGDIIDGQIYGRGAADMKGAVAAFAAAAANFLAARDSAYPGAISLLITGDEEGDAVNGTVKVLEWLRDKGETIDLCVVGEPTNPLRLGEMIKIGRRGSLVGKLTVTGVQGHTAYPHLADNPLHRLVRMLDAVTNAPLDQGTAHFQPSTIQLTTIDVGNTAGNVIPSKATAQFNIRFNDGHSSASLNDWLRKKFDAAFAAGDAKPVGSYDLEIKVSGESFLTAPGELSRLVADAVRAVTGLTPELSTTGGTSDARFIKNYCPVVEFGGVGQTMHKTDERMAVADILALQRIYEGVLARVFPASATPRS
ncbi:MAG: succinyl-diaminopimelate desuccinylase [Alphaproteobacteria bacterium]